MREADDRFVIMRKGDAVVVEFEGVPASAPGVARSLFLMADLVFKPHRLPHTVPNELMSSVGPLPYHGMRQYSAALQVPASVDTLERRAYQRKYNTREYRPGDVHFGPRLIHLANRRQRRAAGAKLRHAA